MASSTAGGKVESGERVQTQLQHGRRKAAALQPPLTPMIDVTFQLLLFFLLTCEFRPTEGVIPGSLPENGPLVGPKVAPVRLDPITIRLLPAPERWSLPCIRCRSKVSPGSASNAVC